MTAGPLRRIVKIICRVLFVLVRPLPPAYFRPFPFGEALRTFIARGILDECGQHVAVGQGARFGNGTGICVGDYSGIGIRSEINSYVTIGRYVMMAPDVVILTQNHRHDRTDIPMCQQAHESFSPVVIGDDVWIGQRVLIVPGVTIGDGCIIGAGAVVAKSVPPYSIAVGNPARVVRSRKAETPGAAYELQKAE